jgi:hypothetical protein
MQRIHLFNFAWSTPGIFYTVAPCWVQASLLALQLPFRFEVRALGGGLVSSAPE